MNTLKHGKGGESKTLNSNKGGEAGQELGFMGGSMVPFSDVHI